MIDRVVWQSASWMHGWSFVGSWNLEVSINKGMWPMTEIGWKLNTNRRIVWLAQWYLVPYCPPQLDDHNSSKLSTNYALDHVFLAELSNDLFFTKIQTCYNLYFCWIRPRCLINVDFFACDLASVPRLEIFWPRFSSSVLAVASSSAENWLCDWLSDWLFAWMFDWLSDWLILEVGEEVIFSCLSSCLFLDLTNSSRRFLNEPSE